ncbi:MAG: beta-propeller domain-containing protein [Acidimicrobiales bacterium]
MALAAGACALALALVGCAGAASPAQPAAMAGVVGKSRVFTAATASYSTTYDQEAGVDEPDLVKTDGRLMAVLRQQPLGVQVVEVGASPPRLGGFLPLPQLASASGLFLVGQDAVVLGARGFGLQVPWPPTGVGAGAGGSAGTDAPRAHAPRPQALPRLCGEPRTDVVVVGLADPARPSVLRSFGFAGQLAGARLVQGQVVLVLSSPPRLLWGCPAAPAGRGGKPAGARRDAVADEAVGDEATGTVSVVSLGDLASGTAGRGLTVAGSAQYVYASATQLFVAASPSGALPPCCPGEAVACPLVERSAIACPLVKAPVPPAEPAFPVQGGAARTTIYDFVIADPARPRYLGSASVPGSLVGGYAMSELGGYLRVATTVAGLTPAPAASPSRPFLSSGDLLTVLATARGRLARVATLQGLGAGEKIDAVLFEGRLGYVATGNQAGTLYVLDLGDPSHPALAGRLALTGLPSLLEPLGAGLLLGVGQSAGPGLQPGGLEVETFDVADLASPVLVSRDALGRGTISAAEADPHALLWWPARRLLVVPVEGYSGNAPTTLAEALSVGPGGVLSKLASLSQPKPADSQPKPAERCPGLLRTVVAGNDLYTVSQEGVMAYDVATLARLAWLPYPVAPGAAAPRS